MAILIELLNSQGRVTERHKFSQPQISLGRGYNNDIILLDPHSCAEHAILTLNEQQQWQLTDMDSVNGVHNQRGQRVSQQPITQSGQEFTLGKQRLRILFSDHPVAATQPLHATERLFQLLSSPWLLLGAILLVALSLGYEFWLSGIGEDSQWHKQLLLIPFILLMFALWPILLAVWARFTGREPRLRPQLALTFSLLVVWACWDIVLALLNFNHNNSILTQGLSYLLPTVMLLAFFWLSFALMSIQRRWLHIGLTLLLSGIYWLYPWTQQTDRHYSPQYQYQLLPQAWLMRQPATTERLLEQSDSLFVETAAEAGQARVKKAAKQASVE
ncbi:FHA domain protein [Arsukibacterium tuosuense]|uniref:FHA domain protein n=1 Tax=Arsukibacterium tuosuense TaxID=1323745 RepID=A0A285INY7_9GAMM|nr:FHA domain-containing protein [Arsukibacterium tuosuense]SNY49730.1 FHA domain protein [Arsukibacterium tuosuense]